MSRPTNMENFFQILSNFGFPITVASYLLFRFEHKLEILEAANEEKIKRIESLTVEITKLKEEIIELERVVKRRK